MVVEVHRPPLATWQTNLEGRLRMRCKLTSASPRCHRISIASRLMVMGLMLYFQIWKESGVSTVVQNRTQLKEIECNPYPRMRAQDTPKSFYRFMTCYESPGMLSLVISDSNSTKASLRPPPSPISKRFHWLGVHLLWHRLKSGGRRSQCRSCPAT